MSTMTLTPSQTRPVDRTLNEAAVLNYCAREALGEDNSSTPLAGLTLDAYRVARDRLVRAGELVRTDAGRYVPAKLAGDGSS